MKITDLFLGYEVTVTTSTGKAVVGTLTTTDTHGSLIRAEVESDHEIKEMVAVYVPHKDVIMVHAREDDNKHKQTDINFTLLYGKKKG